MHTRNFIRIRNYSGSYFTFQFSILKLCERNELFTMKIIDQKEIGDQRYLTSGSVIEEHVETVSNYC